MKFSVWVAVFFLFCLSNTFAGSLEPDSSPAPTMKTLAEIEPRTLISSAPITIDTPGSYYLANNISSETTAVTITASNVTLDLNGFSIIGTGSGSGRYGVHIDGEFSNIEVKNGIIGGFYFGVYDLGDGYSNRILNLRMFSNSYSINVYGSYYTVEGCSVYGGSYGILIKGQGCSAIKNTVHGCKYHGIDVGDGGLILNNISNDNGGRGINSDFVCTIIGNTALNNGAPDLSGASGSTIVNNTNEN